MLSLILVILLLGLFFVIGLLRQKGDSSSEEFYRMGGNASQQDFVSTTAAYSLQVVVTVYFVAWGYSYGWANIWFVLSWAVGFLALSACVPRLVTRLGKHRTMFEFLGLDRGFLRKLAASMILLSTIGLLVAEFEFASAMLGTSAEGVLYPARDTPSTEAPLIAFVVFVLVVIWYASLGGMRKVVVTDKIQLGIGCLSSSIIFLALAPAAASRLSSDQFALLYVPILLVYGTIFVAVLLSGHNQPSPFGKRTGGLIESTVLLVLLAASVAVQFGAVAHVSNAQDTLPVPALAFPKPATAMFTAEAWWAVAGFTLINLVWQFGDYTSYHRLTLLKERSEQDDSEGSTSGRVRIIRRGLFASSLTSPLTWSLGIFLGMALDASGAITGEPFAVAPQLHSALLGAADRAPLMWMAAPALAVFITVVLLSTVDSAFIGAGQLITTDILTQSDSSRSRGATVVAIGIGIIAGEVILEETAVDVWVFVNAAYAWSLAFAPVVIARIINPAFSPKAGLAAASVGAVASNVLPLVAVPWPPMLLLVLPSVSAIIVSSLIILLFSAWTRYATRT